MFAPTILYVFLIFPFCGILAHEAFQTRSLASLMKETDDLELVFLNKSCVSSLSLLDTTIQMNTSNFTIKNIEFTPKTFDLSKQVAFVDGMNTSVNLHGGNAILLVSFDYIEFTSIETKSGKCSGQIALLNISNSKQIYISDYRPRFLTNNLAVGSLNLVFDDQNDSALKKVFLSYFESNIDSLLDILKINMTNCLNDWVYPQESNEMFKDYQYSYQNKIINYSYLLNSLIFSQNFLGFWYDAKISNFTREKSFPLSPTGIIKRITDKSMTIYSKSLFMNSIAYALEQNYFDFKINDFDYPSQHFDYFIGEIALFMPELRKIFYADEKIAGFCSVSATQNVTYNLIENLGFYVSAPYLCIITERDLGTNIFNLTFSLNYTLVPTITQKKMNFFVENVQFIEKSFLLHEKNEFPQIKPALVDYHMKMFLKETLKGKTFGSNYTVKGDLVEIAKDYIILTTF